jgi:hypothetical protein
MIDLWGHLGPSSSTHGGWLFAAKRLATFVAKPCKANKGCCKLYPVLHHVIIFPIYNNDTKKSEERLERLGFATYLVLDHV